MKFFEKSNEPIEIRVSDKRGKSRDKGEVLASPQEPVGVDDSEPLPEIPPPPQHPFAQGEQIPLKGVWWLVVDIGERGEVVLAPIGLTDKTRRKVEEARRHADRNQAKGKVPRAKDLQEERLQDKNRQQHWGSKDVQGGAQGNRKGAA
jgi:hypothetical protein